MIAMALCAVIGFAVPIALAWWMAKKYKNSLYSILVGAGIFIVFALLLEPILHQLVLKGPHGQAIMGNTLYYALYGGLAAGLFEETGRFLGMKYLLKKKSPKARTGIAYGIGHGGTEMLLIFGVTMISNLALSVMINNGQADTLLASAPEMAREQAQAQFAQLQTNGFGYYLFGVWERLSALILQIGLSVIVWTAVRKGGKWLWLFPAAIFLHFAVDTCCVLLMKSVSMAVVEIFVSAFAIAVGAAGFMLAKTSA